MKSTLVPKIQFQDIEKNQIIFDVRTPAEYKKGHIPGAINLPIFSDEERVEVGTHYKQKGRRPAILLGLDVVGPKMRKLVEEVEILMGAPNHAPPFVIHCWRGGMRSGSLGWLLSLYGFQLAVLDGGYKAYRSSVRAEFEKKRKLVVVGGHTGSGKTLLLKDLKAVGKSVVDLEGLANHRGSAFGSLGLGEQPTQQQFENELAGVLSTFDDSAIWIEDEGRTIGTCKVPNAIFNQLRAAHVIVVEKSIEARLDFLVEIYGQASPQELVERFENITKRLGTRSLSDALKLLEDGNVREAARIALAYYDKSYRYGLAKRNQEKVYRFTIEDEAKAPDIVKGIDAFYRELEN